LTNRSENSKTVFEQAATTTATATAI